MSIKKLCWREKWYIISIEKKSKCILTNMRERKNQTNFEKHFVADKLLSKIPENGNIWCTEMTLTINYLSWQNLICPINYLLSSACIAEPTTGRNEKLIDAPGLHCCKHFSLLLLHSNLSWGDFIWPSPIFGLFNKKNSFRTSKNTQTLQLYNIII